MRGPEEGSFSTRLDPALKRRIESIAEIRRHPPVRTRGLQQFVAGLPERPLHLVPEQDPRPYPDAA